MLCKDGFEGTQATDGLNVSHDSHHNDRRSVNDGNRRYFLSLRLLCGRNMGDVHLLRYSVKLNQAQHLNLNKVDMWHVMVIKQYIAEEGKNMQKKRDDKILGSC